LRIFFKFSDPLQGLNPCVVDPYTLIPYPGIFFKFPDPA
jgi:hypothetical protein